jgi:flagellar hook-associated protein 1 FlgK
LRADYYSRLQGVYGVPGSSSALETLYNDFLASLQALSTSPEAPAARSAVLSAAQVLAQQLNGMSRDIQELRSDAELGLADAVQQANHAIQRIAELNRQLGTSHANDATTASLLDERDRSIDVLASLMDISVVRGDHNQVTVFTRSGIELVGIEAAHLAFDGRGSITAASQWSADPAERSVGTITLVGENGGDVDLIVGKSIRSGQIAAYIEMRDQVLVEAQAQLDEIAAGLARALSDRTVDGTAVTAGAQTGFDIDVGGLLAGNSVRVAYFDNVSGTAHALTLMRVDDAAALPLSNDVTADPNDKVIGLDFSGGMSSVLAQIAAAFGTSSLQFSNPSGTTMRILDDGSFNRVDVTDVSATVTVTTLAGGTAELPFFLDASVPYSGAINATGSQSVGFAQRISINANLLADPSRLVVFDVSILAGDSTRPDFILDRLNGAAITFSPESGIGTTTLPFSGTMLSFMRQVISQQGEAAESAASLSQGQQIVFNSLRQRFNDTSGVDIDAELANLLGLQNAYAANARVMTAIKEMLDTLLSI